MKGSELRPCDNCGKALTGKATKPEHKENLVLPFFYKITVQRYELDKEAIDSTLGLSRMFGGAFGLAEVMSPNPELANESGNPEELLLCADCIMTQEISIAGTLGEKAIKEGEASRKESSHE